VSADDPLVAAIPNVSEGRDPSAIGRIAAAWDGDGAHILHIDSNADAHRTVLTVAGPLSAIERACLRGVGATVAAIDMRNQQGAHPRIGAADVVPIVPLDDGTGRSAPAFPACEAAVRRIAERLAKDLGLPIFLYERSARRTEFQALPRCRRGGWEALPARFQDPEDGPDLGPRRWTDDVARSGATVLGVRDLLVAMNLTLTTGDLSLARQLAGQIRSQGRAGRPSLPGLRAVGWSMPGFGGRAQVSCNLTAPRTTRPWDVLQHVRKLSPVPILGAEPIGLWPSLTLLDAAAAEAGEARPGWPEDVVLHRGAADELLDLGARALGLHHLGDPGPRALEPFLPPTWPVESTWHGRRPGRPQGL
jgi:glutamate formiminotransferase